MKYALKQQLARALGDQYSLEDEVDGGSSRIFLARDRSLYREVAVKVLGAALAQGVSPDEFTRELRKVANLQSPNIVPVLMVASLDDGTPYYTMPAVRATSLRARIKEGPLPISETIAILRDVAGALDFAHARGVVHGNLRPERVLLNGDTAMVTDFGVVRALALARGATTGPAPFTGRTPDRVADEARARTSGNRRTAPREAGTLESPAYIAPEQVVGQVPNASADLFAWGVMAYELLTGVHPFAANADAGDDPLIPLRARLPLLSPVIEGLVMQCLATDPTQRPAGARSLLNVLRGPSGSTPLIEPKTTSRRPLILGVAVAVLAIVAVVATMLLRTPEDVRAARGAAVGLRTMAVLPVTDAAEDTATSYLAAGMTDELTRLVAQLSGLQVTARSATRNAPLSDVNNPVGYGARLGVEAVLEVRLQRDGDRLRMTALLTKVADGSTLFRESFERDARELFSLEDDIAGAVAQAFRLPPLSGENRDPMRTANLEAHDLVTRGNLLVEQFSDSALREAVTLYERAAALEPRYLPAWTGLVDAWRRLADDFMPAREAVTAARPAEQRGWALDSTSSRAIALRAARLFLHARDLSQAEREFARALALDSTNALAPLYADLLLQLGKADSAVAVLQRAARIDPMSPVVARYGPPLLAGVARMEPLRAVCSRAVDVDSSAYTFDCLRMELRVANQWREYQATCDSLDHACQGVALHRLGRQDEARRRGARLDSTLRARSGGRYLDPGLIATWYAQMGDVERTLAQLELALSIDSRYVAHLRDPFFFSEVKGEPRFEAFVRKAGLR